MTSEKMLLKKVQPNYPREARRNGIQGVVVMKGVIAIDGSIKELKLVSGHPLLADSAMDSVRQWRYKPYILKAEPVEVETLITVNYELRP
jgi:protein TonB